MTYFRNRVSTIRVTRNRGLLLLGIWLILTGLVPVLHLSFEGLSLVLGILAIVAGAFILLGQ